MKNLLDYLWYKTYKSKLYNRGQSMPFVLAANLYTIGFLIFGGFFFSFSSSILIIILSFALTCPYERNKKKQIKVIRKYYNESEKSRIRGNIIVALYVILSFVVLFLVAKYHITIQNIL
ncbi:MAG: hypothetical protein LBJ63_11485 [Prevotellaceae bacterium]|jgi:hypothetical protein|nr:hypothetical protein [Prevotellaceae bacterium]